MQIHVRAPFIGGHDVISSITPCDGVCAGASPVGHPNFDGPKFADYRTHNKGWLLTVREPPEENSVSRVRVPLAKTPYLRRHLSI